MKTTKITIRNDFHRTAVTLLLKPASGLNPELTKSQINRACRQLCGIDGCACGGPIGDRPVCTQAIAPDRVEVYRHQPE